MREKINNVYNQLPESISKSPKKQEVTKGRDNSTPRATAEFNLENLNANHKSQKQNGTKDSMEADKPMKRTQKIMSLSKLVPFKAEPPPQPLKLRKSEERKPSLEELEGWSNLPIMNQGGKEKAQQLFVPKNPRKFKKSPRRKN